MNDISDALTKLHVLVGAEFSRMVKQIALMPVFHPLANEPNIYSAGGENDTDYNNLLAAARKAVDFGYRVFILPNPNAARTADFIFEYRGIYILYDLKTIQGKGSAGSRLLDSIDQSNRVLLHITTDYNARLLASDLKEYFEVNKNAIEVMIFKGKKRLSVTRRFAANPMFNRLFRRMYEK